MELCIPEKCSYLICKLCDEEQWITADITMILETEVYYNVSQQHLYYSDTLG